MYIKDFQRFCQQFFTIIKMHIIAILNMNIKTLDVQLPVVFLAVTKQGEREVYEVDV